MESAIAHKVDAFFAQYPTISYEKGKMLLHAHDNPTHVYHLVEGRVKQYDISFRGDEVVLNMFKPPAFFPMSYAINRNENVYFFQAETDLELQKAPIDDTVAFLKAHPDVLFNLLARVYRGTDGLLGRLAHLMAGSARSRIMYELLVQGRRFGKPYVDGGVLIPANESEIGSMSGLARETVNREINKLKSDGFIAVTKNEIVIKDLDQLAANVSPEL